MTPALNRSETESQIDSMTVEQQDTMADGQTRTRPRMSFGINRPVEPAPVPAPAAPPATAEASIAGDLAEDRPAAKPGVAPSRRGKKGVTFYLTTPGWKELRNLSMDEDRSTADLMVEATNLLFEKYGRPRIAQG